MSTSTFCVGTSGLPTWVIAQPTTPRVGGGHGVWGRTPGTRVTPRPWRWPTGARICHAGGIEPSERPGPSEIRGVVRLAADAVSLIATPLEQTHRALSGRVFD